ncbi:MAG TPA: hypothetical protein VHL58_03105 [Thermoanaerobaculia bacterium]|nr:hypothetical protein [Chthoniobacterales bacterium]HVT02346.1 hypothetical protein [Thermoanaerobaculia bacterium]
MLIEHLGRKLRLYLVSLPVDEPTFDRIDRDAALIVFVGSALENIGESMLRRIVSRRSMLLSVGEGRLGKFGLAAALFSDFFALKADAEIDFASGPSFPAVAAALLRRTERGASSLLLRHAGTLDACQAQQAGIADALVPRDVDSLEWAQEWIGGRSILALQSGASLLRQRHPFAERAEFARLFATAEPRHGMRMFLARKPLDFRDRYHVEKI